MTGNSRAGPAPDKETMIEAPDPPPVPRRLLARVLFAASLLSALALPILDVAGVVDAGTTALVFPAGGVLYAILGLLITRRQPANRIALLSLLTGFGMTFMGLLSAVSPTSLARWPGGQIAKTLQSLLSPFVILGPFFLLPLLFPDGRPSSRRWGWLAWLMVGMGAAIGILDGLDPAPDTLTGNESAWLAISDDHVQLLRLVQQVKLILIYTWIPAILLGPISLVLRWRRSRGTARRQLFAFVSLTGLVIGLQIAIELLGGALPGFLDSTLYLSVTLLSWLSLPVIFGLTVLRYRLYDVELLINRAMVYGALSALLALLYFGSVVLLQSLFRLVSGGDSPLVIVLSTLFIAALFTPLRQRVQNLIDRRFYRRQYDARRMVQRFAATARDEVNLQQITGALLQSIDETMQPDGLSIWLKDHPTNASKGSRHPSP